MTNEVKALAYDPIVEAREIDRADARRHGWRYRLREKRIHQLVQQCIQCGARKNQQHRGWCSAPPMMSLPVLPPNIPQSGTGEARSL